jgi:hypothetical protein
MTSVDDQTEIVDEVEAQTPVPASLTFKTTAKTGAGTDEDDSDVGTTLDFVLDDRRITAYKPKTAVFGVLFSASSRRASSADQLFMLFDFLDNVLDSADVAYIRGRILDSKDSLGVSDIGKIVNSLVENWLTDDEIRSARKRGR